jgi:hypothetical protein
VYSQHDPEHSGTNPILFQNRRSVGQILASFMFKPIYHIPLLEARNPTPKRVVLPSIFPDIGDP